MSRNAYAEPDRANLELALKIVNQAGVSDSVLLTARHQVERIFRRAGIEIAWQDGYGLISLGWGLFSSNYPCRESAWLQVP